MSVISEGPHAVLKWVSDNEIAFDQKGESIHGGATVATLDDPTKLRLGAWLPPDGPRGFYCGCIAIDILTGDPNNPHRQEIGFVKVGVDETIQNDRDYVPIVELFLRSSIGDTSEADEARVVTATRKAVVVHVPLVCLEGANVGMPASLGPVKVSRFYSDDGRYAYNVQGDPTPDYPKGRIVQYDTHGSEDEAAWTAVAILKPNLLGVAAGV